MKHLIGMDSARGRGLSHRMLVVNYAITIRAGFGLFRNNAENALGFRLATTR